MWTFQDNDLRVTYLGELDLRCNNQGDNDLRKNIQLSSSSLQGSGAASCPKV
jgi:hypothetical protein